MLEHIGIQMAAPKVEDMSPSGGPIEFTGQRHIGGKAIVVEAIDTGGNPLVVKFGRDHISLRSPSNDPNADIKREGQFLQETANSGLFPRQLRPPISYTSGIRGREVHALIVERLKPISSFPPGTFSQSDIISFLETVRNDIRARGLCCTDYKPSAIMVRAHKGGKPQLVFADCNSIYRRDETQYSYTPNVTGETRTAEQAESRSFGFTVDCIQRGILTESKLAT